jgi:hydroxypyruvate isomerase
VGSPKVKVLFDIYHQQITEGHIISRISNNIDKIGHFHAAGNPGRHELYSGELNYKEIFKVIDNLGYKGSIGFVYFPVDVPAAGIKAFV